MIGDDEMIGVAQHAELIMDIMVPRLLQLLQAALGSSACVQSSGDAMVLLTWRSEGPRGVVGTWSKKHQVEMS